MQAQAARAAVPFLDYTPLPESLVVNGPIVFQTNYLQARLGADVGYKTGLTSSVAQHGFAAGQPALAVPLNGM